MQFSFDLDTLDLNIVLLKMAIIQMQCLSTIWLKVTVIFIYLLSPLKGYFACYSARYIKSSHENEYFWLVSVF